VKPALPKRKRKAPKRKPVSRRNSRFYSGLAKKSGAVQAADSGVMS
jgi:hypothetical protein